MTGPAPERPQPSPLEPRLLLPVGGLFYLVLGLLGWLWLWVRDRGHLFASQALGDRGLWPALGIGAALGLSLAALAAAASRRLSWYGQLERKMSAMIGPLEDRALVWLALVSGLAEEIFFRLAAQDALGMLWAAALFAALNTGPGLFWTWTLVAFGLGLTFGAIVEAGCGLLSVSVAHAVMNYLTLRRWQSR